MMFNIFDLLDFLVALAFAIFMIKVTKFLGSYTDCIANGKCGRIYNILLALAFGIALWIKNVQVILMAPFLFMTISSKFADLSYCGKDFYDEEGNLNKKKFIRRRDGMLWYTTSHIVFSLIFVTVIALAVSHFTGMNVPPTPDKEICEYEILKYEMKGDRVIAWYLDGEEVKEYNELIKEAKISDKYSKKSMLEKTTKFSYTINFLGLPEVEKARVSYTLYLK